MRKIDYEEFENIIDKLIDNLQPNNVYLLSSQILYRKVKNKECFNNQDWKVLKIILEDYMKRVKNNECKKYK